MGHREEYKVNVERAKSGLRHRNVRDLVDTSHVYITPQKSIIFVR